MPLEEAPEDGEEEIYFVPHDDGEVVFGAGEVSTVYYDALVDSGASFNALAKALAKYLKNKRRGRTSVRDYTGNLRTMANWSGNVTTFAFSTIKDKAMCNFPGKSVG